MRGLWLTAALAGGLLVGLAGGSAHATTLQDALATAYQTNPTLQAGRFGVGSLDETVAEAVAAWRPSLSAAFGTARRSSYARSGALAQDGIVSHRQAGVQVSQLLYDFGRTGHAVDAAEKRVKAGRARLIGNEQNILLTAAQAYMDVLRAEAVAALSRRNVEVLGRQVAAAQAGLERQLATRTDVAQAEARRADARAVLEEAVQQLETARAVYIAVVGEAPADLAFPGSLPPLPVSADVVIARAVEEVPAVEAARAEVAAASAEVGAATAGLMPTISLQGSSTFNRDPTPSIDSSNDKVIGLQVSVPLWSGGVQQARIRGRKFTLAEARQRLEAARRDARQQAVAAWQALEAARARIDSFQASVTANEIAYEGAAAEYQRLGTRTLLDVLNAEQELFTARVSLEQARRDEVVAAYGVLASMGGLTAAGLALPVAVHDPAPHLERARGAWFRTDIDGGQE